MSNSDKNKTNRFNELRAFLLKEFRERQEQPMEFDSFTAISRYLVATAGIKMVPATIQRLFETDTHAIGLGLEGNFLPQMLSVKIKKQDVGGSGKANSRDEMAKLREEINKLKRQVAELLRDKAKDAEMIAKLAATQKKQADTVERLVKSLGKTKKLFSDLVSTKSTNPDEKKSAEQQTEEQTEEPIEEQPAHAPPLV